MDKDFMQYVYARIERALTENPEYMKLQSKCVDACKDNNMELYEKISCETEARAQELCYLQGYNDAMRMLFNLK